MSLVDIKSMFKEELVDDFIKNGCPGYKADQVYSWLTKGVCDFNDMLNISKLIRQQLSKKYYIANAEVVKVLISEFDETTKYLFKMNDGEFIESVLMRYHHGYTICISTQVGCKMGCKFCATGQSGFSRNLTASEMISQIQAIQLDKNIKISNVVLMGMGEPLDNYDNVIRFLKIVSSEDSLNIGMRHISLSTCGLVDKIYDLAEYKFQLTLSVSLHAPNDLIRNQIMPINKRFNIKELLEACKFYIEKTNRRISFEYAMISDVNDSYNCAIELAKILSGMLCHVNLIPVNNININNNEYKKSSHERLKKFSSILEQSKINVTVRRTLGSDINASCGQLRGNVSSKEGVKSESMWTK